MKRFAGILSILIILANQGFSQDKYKDKDPIETGLTKPSSIEDRAAGTHNAGNMGLFFENRGKLYPRRLSQGPSGEFPVNSGMHYIYRINPMVGIPGNVIQGRYTTNEEWEAVGGYHNPAYTKIAFSDNPRTWHPDLGWPVKDADGNPIIKSDQDSYCVYNDANNGVKQLGIHVAQTGYSYGVKFAQNILFFKYEIYNEGAEDLDDVYFNMYTDIDLGNISGGAPEYADDKVDFVKELNMLYFYDTGYSSEWPGNKTGQFAMVFLKTPEIDGKEAGITDFHYNLYDYDTDRDDLQYAIMSGDTSYLDTPSSFTRFFHPGADGNLHYDDPATIPAGGLDILANVASGPYKLNRGDTLVFYTAMVAGSNHKDLLESVDMAYTILELDFEASKPPAIPHLSAVAGDGKVTLFWDDIAEKSLDNFSGEYDFEGYRLYRSVDYGLHWDQNDRNVDPSVGVDPVPLVDFDVINDIGVDSGLEYSFVDITVNNGFEYWYSVTSYDRGDSTLESLENSKGSTLDAINTVAATPASKAIDRSPVQSDDVHYLGTGQSNYVLKVQPVDDDNLSDQEYRVGFGYVARKEAGRLKTQIRIEVTDSSRTLPERYGIKFVSPSSLNLFNLNTDEEIGAQPKRYVSGARYTLNPGVRIYLTDPDPSAPAEDLPKAGDYITINFAVFAVKNEADTVIAPRTFFFERPQATSDGVIFTMIPPEIIQEILRESGSDNFNIDFRISDETAVQNNVYLVSVEQSGVGTGSQGYINLVVRDTTMTTVATFDTLNNSDEIEFFGITGRVEFPSSDPPSPGNVFSIHTVVPRSPNLLDGYGFNILGSYIDKSNVSEQINQIKVVPNPYIAGSLYEREYGELRREPLRQLKFINLPAKCTIHIFTVAGDLVQTIYHNDTNGSTTWDLRAKGNREVAPGIYIYVVKTDDQEFRSQFAIIK